MNHQASSQSSFKTRGFTLIELLVVIAIIAILAAILFPVFAQAREKARAISCLSNIKQQGLALLMYSQDYDEIYPFNTIYDFSSAYQTDSWIAQISPYIKSIDIFWCPDDSTTGGYNRFSTGGWGPAVSYAGNALCGGAHLVDNTPAGIIGVVQQYAEPGWSGFFHDGVIAQAAVAYPASTIAIGEHLSVDNQYTGLGWIGANTEWTWPTSIVIWDDSPLGGSQFYEGINIPNGTISATLPYPNGPTGAISTKHNAQSNFVFSDGHAKAMRPAATNPDSWNNPHDNMWVAARQ